MYMISVVALVTEFVRFVAALPAGVRLASWTVTVSGDAPPLTMTSQAPLTPRSASAMVSDADTAAGVHATPAAVGRVAVSSAMTASSVSLGEGPPVDG